MDATPITLGQEFSGYYSQINKGIIALTNSLENLSELAIGGTAVGTGINAPSGYAETSAELISNFSGLNFVSAKNKFASIAAHDALVETHGALKLIANSLFKITNDIRFMGSGPRSGIGEILIPVNEPGSSIMPGKVNPTQCEAMAQVCLHLMGLYNSNIFAGTQGHFQLNANKTVLLFNTLRIIELLSDAINSFSEKCLKNIVANKKKIDENLEKSLMLVTALNPKIGYTKASEIAKKAFAENITLKDAAIKLDYLDSKEFDLIVDPKKMIKGD